MLKFLKSNAHWQLNRNPFAHLIAPTTTMDNLVAQLHAISNSYYPQVAPVDTQQTEFCLNSIALSIPKTPTQIALKKQFGEQWQGYLALKRHFNNKLMLFPANTTIRIEKIAQLVTKCTAFCLDASQREEIVQKAADVCLLTDLEIRNLPHVLNLYKINLYCALYQNSTKGNVNTHATAFTSASAPPTMCANKQYAFAGYRNDKTHCTVDCFGNSATTYANTPTNAEQRLFVYANGQNVFDTFTHSAFLSNSSHFCASGATLKVAMRHFVHNNCEYRKITLTNCGKRRTFQLQYVVYDASNTNKLHSQADNAIVLSTSSGVAMCVVAKTNHMVDYTQNSLCVKVKLEQGQSASVDICTVLADNCENALAQAQQLNNFGATNCPYVTDKPHPAVSQKDIALSPTMHGQARYPLPTIGGQKLNFSYQLGDNDLATFVDNSGNSATLIKGFVFGTKGESIFAVGTLTKQLNTGKFVLDGDKLVYTANEKSHLSVHHTPQTKVYNICHLKSTRTLFYYPLHEKSQVIKLKNGFWINQKDRQFELTFNTPIESYTTNALNCNSMRLRHKLDNDLSCGTCLAVTLAPSTNVTATLHTNTTTPRDTPLIKESLISTYLNYSNDKNLFALCQRLSAPTPFALAAMCYTNPAYVKGVLQTTTPHTAYCFTDKTGKLLKKECPLAYALGAVYYQMLVGDLCSYAVNLTRETLLNSTFQGKDACVQMLALKKASQMESPFKVQYLVKLAEFKKTVAQSPMLSQYAQAIGALPMTNPSKQRLKDLCNSLGVPQCWYYVSQLENLYGLSISPKRISVTPRAKQGLEQLTLHICGKRIDTTFLPATTQSMTLNGTRCFLPFCPQTLKHPTNNLVVYY